MLTVPPPRPAPALQPERERDAERRRDEHADDAEEERVLRAPRCSAGSWSTLPGSPVNQRSEKPCQVVRERPSLNANSTAIATGMIDQTM